MVSALAAKSQSRVDIKKQKPKIKNPNVVMVPDQKLVIIEKAEDPVVVKRKQNSAGGKNNSAPGQSKKITNSKKAKPSARGQGEKAPGTNEGERIKEK